ncbi:MAG: DUF3578 domain-containing protein [Eubacteriales bacterium]|nr:DUF3578 domain-containing protein [Eubacteriales bacterium]
MSKNNLRDLFSEFMDKYSTELSEARQTENFKRPFGSLVRKDIVNNISSFMADKTYYIKGSVGAGRWTDVPWIAIFDTRITKSAQKGIYIVYLLNKDTKELYLTFNQGATDVAQEGSSSDGKLAFTGIASSSGNKTLDKLRNRAQSIREKLCITEGIDIDNVETGSPAYNAGCICYKKYTLENIPDDEKLKKDLLEYIEIYKNYYLSLQDAMDNWWPSLVEYNPAISKDQWLKLLEDGTTFTENAYFAIAAMYDFGGTATCRQLEEKYGKTSDFYRASLGVQLASKIKNKLDLPYCVGDKDKNQVWPILFQGRAASSDEPGNYVWRIRPELYDALKEFGIERYLKEGEEEVQELSIKDSMKLIKEYIASKGFSYDNELIENFYLSLKSKPFVILAGTSGTGKTRLVRLFAEAIGANYKLVSVRPDWSDSSDLFGHVNLKGEFVPGAIIDYIHEAAKPENINIPYFLCLDEMNLARVEYYLSDFLSIIETRHREDGYVVTDEIILDKAAADTYGKVVLPENLYVIGTVNMDETTFPFSKKVLDRANTIEFSYVDLVPDFSEIPEETEAHKCRNSFLKTDYITLMSDIDVEDRQFVSDICIELQAINKILQGAQAHVGYRVRDEIVFYMLNNKKAALLDTDLAFDNEIMQKILPRIQGSSASIKDMLCELYKKCAGDYTGLSQASVSEQMQAYIETKDCKYRKSAEKICYMMRRFEEDGFTSYWL